MNVGASFATPAKIAVIGALQEEAGSGLLAGIEIHYAWPGEVGPRCIYGGGWRFEQEDALAEIGLLRNEIIAVSLYVRVLARPAVDVQDTDLAAHEIGNLLGKVFAGRPQLAGGLTWLGISGGQGDYSRTADETVSIHAFQVRVGTRLTWS